MPKGTDHKGSEHCFVGLLGFLRVNCPFVNVPSHPDRGAVVPVIHDLPESLPKLYPPHVNRNHFVPSMLSLLVFPIVTVPRSIHISILKTPGNVVLSSNAKTDYI